jgi:hypothetical protein
MISKMNQHFLCAALIIIVLGCDDGGQATQFGSPISNRNTIPIAALFADAAAYEGKSVSVQGEIDMQDQKGYWFYVHDGDARIYVELYQDEFSIPDLIKRKILVEGVVEVKLDIPSLLASGVECQQ